MRRSLFKRAGDCNDVLRGNCNRRAACDTDRDRDEHLGFGGANRVGSVFHHIWPVDRHNADRLRGSRDIHDIEIDRRQLFGRCGLRPPLQWPCVGFPDGYHLDAGQLCNCTAGYVTGADFLNDLHNFGQSVTLTAVVLGTTTTPTGTVTFYDGSTPLATKTLSGGQASFTTSALPVSNSGDVIYAVYNGTASMANSTSPNVTVGVSPAPTTVTLTDSQDSVDNVFNYGTSLKLTAEVAATGLSTAPTGTVVFYDAGTEIGQGTLSKGAATLTFVPDANVAFFDVGNGGEQNVTAQFTGSTDFASSTSNTEQLAVEQVTSAVSLAASPGFALVGQPITFVATVTNQMVPTSAPTGSVEFFEGSTVLGTPPLNGGVATYTTTALGVGSDSVSADFIPTDKFSTPDSVHGGRTRWEFPSARPALPSYSPRRRPRQPTVSRSPSPRRCRARRLHQPGWSPSTTMAASWGPRCFREEWPR